MALSRHNADVKSGKLFAILAIGLGIAWPVSANAGSRGAPIARNLVATAERRADEEARLRQEETRLRQEAEAEVARLKAERKG